MPKIDIRDYQDSLGFNPENHCPHCGSDEYSIHEDGLLRCDYCLEIIVENEYDEVNNFERIPTKKKLRE